MKIDVGSIVVSSPITNMAGDELKLKPSQQAYAAIQASDVMLGRLSAEARTVATALMNSDDSSYHTSEAAGEQPAGETYPHSVIGLQRGRKCGEGMLVNAAEPVESQEKDLMSRPQRYFGCNRHQACGRRLCRRRLRQRWLAAQVCQDDREPSPLYDGRSVDRCRHQGRSTAS